MRYCILAPPKVQTSSGIMAQYYMNDHLIAAGQTSRVITLDHTGTVIPPDTVRSNDDEIVIIPDTFPGNIFGAKNVVRQLFMFAGYFGHQTTFPASEYIYYYTPEFCIEGREPENILTVPIIDESRFKYQPDGRSGTCHLIHKYSNIFGQVPTNLPPDSVEITKSADIEELFRTKKTLITYDNSGINLEAAWCGMDIEYRLNPHFPKPFTFGDYFDYNDVRGSYMKLKEKYFTEQLPTFIARTQERFR